MLIKSTWQGIRGVPLVFVGTYIWKKGLQRGGDYGKVVLILGMHYM